MGKFLSAQGHEVVAFLDGAAALIAAVKRPPDLILLDVRMPGLDGYQVCERLKADVATREVPVIFVSALGDVGDKVRAFAVGGVDYVTKPYQFEEVNARVSAHLELRRIRQVLLDHDQHLQELVYAQVKEISDSQMATIFALARLAEFRDDKTGKHLERIRTFCRILAKRLGDSSSNGKLIDKRFVANIDRASAMHDIGKVGIPDAILLKPGKLTVEEFEQMKRHAVLGASVLEAIREQYPGNEFINMSVEIARAHHEAWDGSGYPDGKRGEEIPLSARIVALADVYDAVTSVRCYKAAVPHEQSVEIIRQEGARFDPAVLQAFLDAQEEFRSVRGQMGE